MDIPVIMTGLEPSGEVIHMNGISLSKNYFFISTSDVVRVVLVFSAMS